jgi:hypothetical membrane protein
MVLSRWSPVGAVAGPVVFTISFVLLGRQPGYDPVRQQISVLAVLPGGAWLDVAFVACGLLMIVGVLGLAGSLFAPLDRSRRRAVVALLSVMPVGMVGCGCFPIDGSTPLHFVGANAVFLGPVLAFPATGAVLLRVPRLRTLGVALLVAGAVTALAVAGYLTGAPTPADFRSLAGGGTLGLRERIAGEEIVAWYAGLGVLGVVAGRRPAPSPGRDRSR